MVNLVALYQQHLHLQSAIFSLIEHDDAMVAIVYKVTQPTGIQLILKICKHPHHYLREVYFLKHFAGKLPVPRIIEVVQPEIGIDGAILMEYLPGTLLKITDFSNELAYEMGSMLARIHLNREGGYGDLAQPQDLSTDPRIYFTLKFDESFSECISNLSETWIKRCRHYYDTHLDFLNLVDGPCIVHRDFRPGNVIVKDDKIRGIIDWSSGRAGFAQEDFCSMEHGEWSTYPESKKFFLSGYTSIRPLPDYTAMMPLLRLSKALATIGFTVKNGTWKSIHAHLYQFNCRFLDTFLKAL